MKRREGMLRSALALEASLHRPLGAVDGRTTAADLGRDLFRVTSGFEQPDDVTVLRGAEPRGTSPVRRAPLIDGGHQLFAVLEIIGPCHRGLTNAQVQGDPGERLTIL